MWYVGLDWADQHHDIVVLDEAGRRVGSRRVPHSQEGLEDLKLFLLNITPHLEEIVCVVETSHGLLITFLLETGIPVYPVNPKTANALRKAAGAKTDQIDAYLLAKTGRFDQAELRRLAPDSPKVQELKTLTRDQDALVQMQTRLVNQLTACLKDYYPAALTFFAKLQQHSTLIFLHTYPTPEAAGAASIEEMEETLRQGKHRNPAAVAKTIAAELSRPHLRAKEVIVRTKSRLALSLIKQLLVVVEDIAAYEKEIATLFLTHEDQELFASLPGAGPRLAPRLLAEWGDDRTRYQDAGCVQTLAGTAPVPFSSGNFARAHKRFACVKPLRNALYQFAWESIRQEAWARAYYRRKRAEGKSHSMAVRALAQIWVRILYRMWMNKTCYQTETFEAAQRVHAKRAA
ncbi:IS110 family transposase [Tengunoibacter tsumagoiensis]|nr:IS110 family transposase [Tengunoibacter tsumagoiensis]